MQLWVACHGPRGHAQRHPHTHNQRASPASPANPKGPPKSISPWTYIFLIRIENSKHNLLINQVSSLGRHSKKNLIPCISFSPLSPLPQIRKSHDRRQFTNAKLGDVFWAEVQAPCYFSRPGPAAQRHNLAERGPPPLLLPASLGQLPRKGFHSKGQWIYGSLLFLQHQFHFSEFQVQWAQPWHSRFSLHLILKSICPRSICQGYDGSFLPGTWVCSITLLLISRTIPIFALPLQVLLALSWLNWHEWYNFINSQNLQIRKKLEWNKEALLVYGSANNGKWPNPDQLLFCKSSFIGTQRQSLT